MIVKQGALRDFPGKLPLGGEIGVILAGGGGCRIGSTIVIRSRRRLLRRLGGCPDRGVCIVNNRDVCGVVLPCYSAMCMAGVSHRFRTSACFPGLSRVRG